MANDASWVAVLRARTLAVAMVLMLVAVMGHADTAAAPAPPPSPTLIQLVDPLDEPQFYCVDVPGFGARLNLDGALTAHTCKPRADDELFTVGHPSAGHLYMPAYDRCVEADGATADAEVHLSPCADDPLQRFVLTDDGELRLEAPEGTADERAFCLAVEPGAGQPTGGPSHLRRGLHLSTCAGADSSLKRWILPGVRPVPPQ